MKILHRLLNRIPYTVYFILLFLSFPSPAFAGPCDPQQIGGGVIGGRGGVIFPGRTVADFSCLEGIYTNILHYAIAGASIGFFIMILSGGLKWLTSSGDPKDIENAKGRITFAAFGLFLMIAAWFILKFISVFTLGAGTTDILQFKIPQ